MKILTVIGARPQFIKAAPISAAIKANGSMTEVLVHTGQHFDQNMSDVFFTQMGIPKPNYLLNINSLSHGAMTGRMLEEIEKICIDEKPNLLLVYGDTNSTLAGALAAKKLNIKVAHIEAGLRSFNMAMPEEINRIMTDHISDILFCPTETAIKNLRDEGVLGKREVVNCGDVMLDSSIYFGKMERAPQLDMPESFILATVHRQENTDDQEKLRSIFSSIKEIALRKDIILPLHPRTKKKLDEANITISDIGGLNVLEPQGYLETLYLLKRCSLLMTDSGGMQKEAYFFEKPCVTLREETEWVELVENGYNYLVGSNSELILSTVKNCLENPISYQTGLYGQGNAAETIVDLLSRL